ncbi:tetrahydrodipicolinate N-succinyltransferase N-terminal domain-containing protein [Nitratiruptor sp. SB155-2]|uniref:2,3,4,5-tetrahydropyridine-2,6-dicarboxylate N-succinyltransferase n=1 Tax=Nitratiruptor sp. (strain SB155-2) TaxID=387092 RepID=DAPD_NITSB|nr:tetrahydrodipicolinate N-succinyltransferase N-terminal domain-containing protein [Nitratiruptor sp. SB155-2]A6Q5J0.1 RecName: Full=2,3,4,5-tetrahydropyridine-2,6-dicarboxylate N-succinyltransferase; AltName: Full=Tetrahydrodipicolinate N-succinyltransferase; Short=THDP succinyltransferase; Short=THP succinyltransferase; AltName: Full=Tetrahydropicolinate succinylase [Nitratiruptor sp. SB155-2]BAF70749.1 tetrahydrodipicolinate N-succinyltransferase [Nitratiruptor sp. SB155-2]
MIQTKDDFFALVNEIQSSAYYKEPLAFGIARVDRGQKNPEKILQATFPFINWKENYGSAAIFQKALHETGKLLNDESEAVYDVTKNFVAEALSYCNPWIEEAIGDAHKNVQVIKYLSTLDEEELANFKIVFLFEDAAPKSVEAVYLKLYALSTGKAALRSVNLNGAFGILHNVAWSGTTPIELDWLRENELELKMSGQYPVIDSVDKFPRFLQHIIPADNTRILDAAKVRMGAQLAAGTTVMPGASYINFNAGTLGPVMVEGRISSSAVVGKGSDVGGGASILGVLSGTSGNPISIGENCLLGANSVTGIPLGNGCIVDAGIAVLEGTKFFMSEADYEKIKEANPEWNAEYKEFFKGRELAGLSGLHFRQDSTSGQMKVFRSNKEVKLNEELH